MDEIKQQIREVMKEERDDRRRRMNTAAKVFTGDGVGLIFLMMGLVVFLVITNITEDLPGFERAVGLSVGAIFAVGTLIIYRIEVNHTANYARMVKIAEKLGIPESELE
jgi:hypothetical protein